MARVKIEFLPRVELDFDDEEFAEQFLAGFEFARKFKDFDTGRTDPMDPYYRGTLFWVKVLAFCRHWRIDESAICPFSTYLGWRLPLQRTG